MSSKKLNQLKDFLKKHKNLVLERNYAELYRRLTYYLYIDECDLTDLLYSAGINVLEHNLKCIPVMCFAGLNMAKFGLSILEIPVSVERIGVGAFSKTGELDQVTIPVSCHVGPDAFESSVDLREVILTGSGKSVGGISVDAFDGCVSLQRIVIPEEVSTHPSIPVEELRSRGIKVELK